MHQHSDITKENFEEWNEKMVLQHGTLLEHRNSHAIVRLIESLRVRAIVKLLDPKESDRILEVGCGAGNILESIRKGQLAGLDLSETLLAIAQKRLGSRARLVKGNAEDMVKLFPGEVFSKVFASEVLEHVLHPAVVVTQIRELMDSNGVFVVSIPNEKLIKFIKKVLIRIGLFRVFLPGKGVPRIEYEWHLHDFDLQLLRDVVKGLFDITKVRRIPFGFLPLRYVVKMRPVSTENIRQGLFETNDK